VRQRHPPFKQAVMADLALEPRFSDGGEPRTRVARYVGAVRAVLTSDAFGALLCYRIKATCQRRGVPVIPHVAHRAALIWAGIAIGDPVVVHPGVRLMHGHIVIDGFTEIHPGVQIRPFVTIGRRGRTLRAPTIGPDVAIGTGAKVLGPIVVGAGARIGANAVVIHDVAPRTTVVGAPARPVPPGRAVEGVTSTLERATEYPGGGST
jgi:serine O-acetyltransferase